MKPQEPIPHNYSMAKLNLIFAASALGLLFVTGGIVLYDYVRGWKWFQWEFMRIQQQRLTQNLQAAEKEENKAKLGQLDKQIKAQEATIAGHRAQYVVAQKELDDWEGQHYAADEDYRFEKAKLDAARYQLEAAVLAKSPDRAQKRQAFQALSQHVDELQLRLQDVTRSRDAAQAQVNIWLKKINDAEATRKDLTASVDLVNKQLAQVAATPNFFLLNMPMLDFISPSFKIDQVVLPDLYVNVNYMQVPRVDRCTTCHRAIDRPGFESKKEAARLEKELQQKLDTYQIPFDKRADTESRIAQLKAIEDGPVDILNPWRTHPKLDLFVGSASAHPLLEYGCTSCHHGMDRATEFGRAGHVPPNLKMEHRWSGFWNTALRQWGYEENEFDETPMYPRQYYEAGCVKCHSNEVQVKGGDQVTKAEATVEEVGCYACHKIANWRFTDLRKPGPDLTGIAEKTTPEWAIRWISEPHDFRSTTRMPSFFYQRNIVGPAVPAAERAQDIKYQDAEIRAIVEYLFSKSKHRTWQAPPAGDPARGKQLVDNVGCMGCHISTETVKDAATGQMRPAKRTDFPIERNYGFNLTGVGTKTNAAWIYNWVKNPKSYYAEAPMPSLRLSDQEAADITSYLVTLQKPQFMQKKIRPVDPAAVRDLAKGYLINTLTERDADAKLKTMPMHEQLVYLGQRTIEKYGCYSCHNIDGFEGLKPIGTELTTEGSKALHLFDFGFVHNYTNDNDGTQEFVHHNVPSWVYNKLRSPRVYDDLRTKTYNDKLKMPNFHLDKEEARLIATVVLGLTKDQMGANRIAAMDPEVRKAQEGLKLVSQHNCRACHIVDGYGRAIASLIPDVNYLPPDLTPEGGRAQSPFLFNFLKDPSIMKIRPWLSVRMPTFGFSDTEANTLVGMFAAEGKAHEFDNAVYTMPPAQNVAVGREIFTMMRCTQCHATTAVDPEHPPAVPPNASTQSLAPNLTLARVRLRHDWIPDWIRRPGEMIPSTRMPANFPRDPATGGFISPLGKAIDTPQFAQAKAALLPYFKDEAELRRTMGDPVQLTGYLRDYIWSIGITQIRAAAPGQAPAPTAPPPLPKPLPAMKTGRSEQGGGATAGR